ncbi:hypothetical protein BCR42DRAFT_408975 [Absidia repens]|uniref:Uncharacterized protein n=1 Tax=Absidia repens TaxID=90262 RepID=A0A1X2IQF3_9FUNG|nr:hypothetical protein BCR42DRAFT_408975 [Absidia repens]
MYLSLDNHPIYTLPKECAKSIRRSFLRTGHAMSLSLRRKRSRAPSTSPKIAVASRSTSTASTLTTSSTNTSYDPNDPGSYPVSSASSSYTQLSDLTTLDSAITTTMTPPSPPENHPPAHVFGKLDQGYSIFYLKLPNGNWMVRCRTADRKIIATYEVDGSMV